MSRIEKKYIARRIAPLIGLTAALGALLAFYFSGSASSTDKSDLLEQMLVEMDRTNSGSQEERIRALSALGQLIPPKIQNEPNNFFASDAVVIESEVVPELLALVMSGNEDERTLSLSILIDLLRQDMIESEDILRELEGILGSILLDLEAEDFLRLVAVDGLGELMPLTPQTIDDLLLTLMQEPSKFISANIASLLARASADHPDLKDDLFQLMEVEDERMQAAILGSLAYMGDADDVKEAAKNVAVDRLSSSSKLVRREAIEALMSQDMFRRASVEDRSAIRNVIDNDSEAMENRTNAVTVLGRMSSTRQNEDGVFVLIEIAGDISYPTELREEAVRSLPFATHYSGDIVRVLEQFAADSDQNVVEAANWALSVIERVHARRMEAIRLQSPRGRPVDTTSDSNPR